MTPKRVLLIKMSSLGDVVHALPAVNDAASHGVEVDWVVEEAFADIPAGHPGVNRVIPVAWRRWRKSIAASRDECRRFFDELRSREYDLVIDSQGLIKSAVVALAARGPRAGFSFTSAREPWAAFAYGYGHRVDKAMHAIDRQRRLLSLALGYEVPGQMYSGLEGSAMGSDRVLLLHGTTWETKHWPLSMWQALARRIAGDGYQPVVTWGNEEEKACARAIAQDGVATVQNRVPLHELGAVLAGAGCVIGVDSGLTHYSAALGTPTLGLYGPTDGLLTGCRGVHAGFLQANTACAPCLEKRCRHFRGEPLRWQNEVVQPPCFATVTPEQVWRRARQLMHPDAASSGESKHVE